MQRLQNVLRLARPLHLLLIALTYILGVGIARYLGKPQINAAFWLGLIGIMLAQLSMNLLAEVFRPVNEPLIVNETAAERMALRDSALYISVAALASLGVIAFLLFRDGYLGSES